MYLACARTKKQAKRQAASELLLQLSSATDMLDNSFKNHESSAATSDHCPETILASHHLSSDKIVGSEIILFHKCWKV